MSPEQTHLSYILAKDVFNGKITNKEAGIKASEYGISPNSQKSYFCSAFRHLITGTKYSGKLSIGIWDHYLSQIFSEYGEKIKINALNCFKMAIEYHETKTKSNAISLRELLKKYQTLV